MDLLDELDAFYLEHRRCGDLKAEVTEGEPLRVMMICSCGGFFARYVASRPEPPAS